MLIRPGALGLACFLPARSSCQAGSPLGGLALLEGVAFPGSHLLAGGSSFLGWEEPWVVLPTPSPQSWKSSPFQARTFCWDILSPGAERAKAGEAPRSFLKVAVRVMLGVGVSAWQVAACGAGIQGGEWVSKLARSLSVLKLD